MMKLRMALYLTILIINLTSFASIPVQDSPVNIVGLTQSIGSMPKVEVEIKLNDTVLNNGDEVILNIKLTNTGSGVQKLLFDKPAISTGGPWATIGKVIDSKTGISVLKYENKAMLSSQIYAEDQLKDKYYSLEPGQSIEGEYALSDIVVFNSSDYTLHSGAYEIQIFYHLNSSNTVALTVK